MTSFPQDIANLKPRAPPRVRGSFYLQHAGPAECSPRAISDLYCDGAVPVKPDPAEPTMWLLP
jgi:hypothetical protein